MKCGKNGGKKVQWKKLICISFFFSSATVISGNLVNSVEKNWPMSFRYWQGLLYIHNLSSTRDSWHDISFRKLWTLPNMDFNIFYRFYSIWLGVACSRLYSHVTVILLTNRNISIFISIFTILLYAYAIHVVLCVSVGYFVISHEKLWKYFTQIKTNQNRSIILIVFSRQRLFGHLDIKREMFWNYSIVFVDDAWGCRIVF